MRRHSLQLAIVCFFLATAAVWAQIGPGPFAAFPTGDVTDGRFLAFACTGLFTIEQRISMQLSSPADELSFTFSVFDGDGGLTDAQSRQHWDRGVRQIRVELYADPFHLESTSAADLIGTWLGNTPGPLSGPNWSAFSPTMPDNDWWGVEVTNLAAARAPSGTYFYNLVMGLDAPCTATDTSINNLKVAASNPMTFETPRFGIEAGLRQAFNDGPIIYPGPVFPPPGGFLTAPTTYDGTFTFTFKLPGGEPELRLFDGDFDFGTNRLIGSPSGAPLDACLDTDDPDTLDYAAFPFAVGVVNPEGIATSQDPFNPTGPLLSGVGLPADDSEFDLLRRGELGEPSRRGCVRYEVSDPLGNVYRNDNPSGNQEWEQFRIAGTAAVNPGDSDVALPTPFVPPGEWAVRIIGLDMNNLNFWYADTCSQRNGGSACVERGVYLLGDFVWADANGNGNQEATEAGVAGVTMELIRVSDGAVIASVTTGDATEPNWAACRLNNTGVDEQGLYCFGVDLADVYRVRVAASNLAPGGVLEGQVSTTGGEEQTNTLVDANVLTYDFGYRPAGSIGDRLWEDVDGDGVQDAGEPGINGVTVELLDGGGAVVGSAVTAGDGIYRFEQLAGGAYSVRVASATLPAGLVPTFDLDGTSTPNLATGTLASGQRRDDFDFGYRGTGSLGDRVWTDTDGDGAQDAGEAGINGVTVELLNAGGTLIATQFTSGDGNYGFANLAAGSYSVRVVAATLPPGLAQTFDLDGIATANVATAALAAAQSRTDFDFGYRGTGSIGDRVWEDKDGDGVQETGEPGINGVTVELLNSGGTVIRSTTTAGDGTYSFQFLLQDTYTVRVGGGSGPAGGYTRTFDLDGITTANIATGTLAAGQARLDFDFGYKLQACVPTMFAFSGDSATYGTRGNIRTFSANGISVKASAFSRKDDTGVWAAAFLGVYGGNLGVTNEGEGDGGNNTHKVDNVGGRHDFILFEFSQSVTVTSALLNYIGADSDLTVWFGSAADPFNTHLTLSDSLLGGMAREQSDTTATVTSRLAEFNGASLAGNVWVIAASLADATPEDEFKVRKLITECATTPPTRGSIGDRVWEDKDGDGVQDAGEAGINGVTVELLDGNGSVVATKATVGDGNYLFDQLGSGNYSVRVVGSTLPAGLAPTFDLDGIGTANIAAATLAAGQHRTDADFGYRGIQAFKGCTPGYWKQTQHFDSWVFYRTTDSFNAVFGISGRFPGGSNGNPTLLQALSTGGGGYRAFNRHATAALLNIQNTGVGYYYSLATLTSFVRDAYSTGNFEDTKNLLAKQNELGCPLN